MITIYGTIELKSEYSIELDVSADEFESLDSQAQIDYVENNMDWDETVKLAEIMDVEIFDLDQG